MRKTLIAVCVIAVFVAGGFLFYNPVGFWLIVFQKYPDRFNRRHMEAVVAQVRLAGLKPGEQREFMLDSVSNPKSLRPWKPQGLPRRGDGAGRVWAEVSPDGKLKVVIETCDLGHAGEYGFAYSDVPLSPKQSGDFYTIDVPALCWVRPSSKIDDHWWKVWYNLD